MSEGGSPSARPRPEYDASAGLETTGLTRKTAIGLTWSGGGLVLQIALNTVSIAILARLLTPHDYGVAGLAATFLELGAMLAGLGMAPALIQRKGLTESHVAAAEFVAIALACTLALIQFLTASLAADFLGVPELATVNRILAILIVVNAFNALSEAMMSRHFRFRTTSVMKLVIWFCSVFGVCIPLALAGAGYWSLIASSTVQIGVTAVINVFVAGRYFVIPRWSWTGVREMASTSVGFSVTQMMAFVATYSDNLVVAKFVGPEQLGIYSRAYFLISMPTTMLGNLNRAVVFPAMSRVQDDKARLRGALLKGLALTAALTLPGGAFLACYSGEFILLLLGPKWIAAQFPFIVFASVIYFRVGYKTCATAIQAAGRGFVSAAMQGAYALMVFIGALIGSHQGIDGVCVGVASAISISFAAYILIAGREVRATARELFHAHAPPSAARSPS